MKKYNKIILIMMIGMILSCSKSFLELTPQQEVADTEALTNIEDYSSSITGIYNTISSPNYYGRYMFFTIMTFRETVTLFHITIWNCPL